MKKSKKIFLYILPFILLLSGHFLYVKENYKVLETSILSILKNVAEKYTPEPPDLAIEKVILRKKSEPKSDFNFYKYNSTIVVHNYGGDLKDARVILYGDENQKSSIIKNTIDGFSLDEGKSYTIRNYEILFDGRYNGGTVNLELELADEVDKYTGNNQYTVEFFENSPKIKSLSVDEILEDGTYVFDFNSTPFSIRKHEFKIMTGEDVEYDKADIRYDEFLSDSGPVGYYRIKNSLRNIKTGFSSKSVSEFRAHYVDSDTDFVYIKAKNPDSGNYAVSNILHFVSSEEINHAQFAKLFIDYCDIDLFDEGPNFFKDVNINEWYGPHVQTLYNLGLLDTRQYEYNPEEKISRGEVLRIVLDYFDVELTIKKDSPHFDDVSEDAPIYPYAEALYASNKGYAFDGVLFPDKPATKDYLKYLINEYSKSN
ncbi:hypothetical protein GF366_03490 [Candidatus Peregrinibacteria bacterium]|nr:hypothetical protein [Candidatus Peregrinibacteria bacterium]